VPPAQPFTLALIPEIAHVIPSQAKPRHDPMRNGSMIATGFSPKRGTVGAGAPAV
jgi:hypothetical protein